MADNCLEQLLKNISGGYLKDHRTHGLFESDIKSWQNLFNQEYIGLKD